MILCVNLFLNPQSCISGTIVRVREHGYYRAEGILLSSVDQLIIVAEVFKIRELMFATFRTHPQHSLIVSIYEEVEKYV